jgi:hypothetical protein
VVFSRTEEISLTAPAVALVVALFISWSNFAIQRWRFRVDRLNVAIDHLSVEVNAAADLATEYWLIDPTDSANTRRIALLEPKLIGTQTKLSSFLLAIEALDDLIETKPAQEKLATLFEAMTGGGFRTLGRPADPLRAQHAQSIGAELMGELRVAAADRSRKWLSMPWARRQTAQ